MQPPIDVTALRPEIVHRVTAAVAAIAAVPGTPDELRPAVVDAIRAARLHLLALPVGLGGLGGGLREAVATIAAIASVDASAGLGLAMHTQVLGGAVEAGTWPAAPYDRLVTAVRTEGALVNAASTEEGTGSPARGGLPETRAVRSSDGGTYRVTGEKTYTTWLPVLRFALVSVRFADADAGAGSDAAGGDLAIGNLLVDLAAPGVERAPGFDALGMRGSASGRLVLRDVAVPSDMVVYRRLASERDPRGPSAQGWFGLALTATYLGVGEGARAAVTRWAVDRRPGDGSAAVADIPSVQVRLGRLDAGLRAARIVALDVARRWEEAAPAARGALLPDVALAKITATNAAVAATDEALRIAGGPGFVAGPIERAFRDARAGLVNPPLDDVAFQGFAATLVGRERGPREPAGR